VVKRVERVPKPRINRVIMMDRFPTYDIKKIDVDSGVLRDAKEVFTERNSLKATSIITDVPIRGAPTACFGKGSDGEDYMVKFDSEGKATDVRCTSLNRYKK
jgi:hypothetical protein